MKEAEGMWAESTSRAPDVIRLTGESAGLTREIRFTNRPAGLASVACVEVHRIGRRWTCQRSQVERLHGSVRSTQAATSC